MKLLDLYAKLICEGVEAKDIAFITPDGQFIEFDKSYNQEASHFRALMKYYGEQVPKNKLYKTAFQSGFVRIFTNDNEFNIEFIDGKINQFQKKILKKLVDPNDIEVVYIDKLDSSANLKNSEGPTASTPANFMREL